MKEYTKYVIISKIKEVLKALFICIGFGLITLPISILDGITMLESFLAGFVIPASLYLIMLLIILFITIKRWLD